MKKYFLGSILILSLPTLNSCSSTADSAVTRLIAVPGKADDSQARLQLRNKTHQAAADSELRGDYEEMLLNALHTAENSEIKKVFIRELQLIGGTDSIRPLSVLLHKEQLCEVSTQALLAIEQSVRGAGDGFFSTYTVKDAVSEAFLKADSPAMKLTLAKAVGSLRINNQDVREKLERLINDSADLHSTALRALANIADASSATILASAIESNNMYLRSKAISWNFLYAERLAENDKKAASDHALNILSTVDKNKEVHSYIKGLCCLSSIKGASFNDDLIARLDDDNRRMRNGVRAILQADNSQDLSKKLMEIFSSSSTRVQAQLLKIFAVRGQLSGALIEQSLASNDPQLVEVSIDLSYLIFPLKKETEDPAAKTVLTHLIAHLLKADKNEARLISALKRIPARDCTALLKDALLNSQTPSAKLALLEVIKTKKGTGLEGLVLLSTVDADKKVKKAAFKTLRMIARASQAGQVIEMLRLSDSSSDIKAYQSILVSASHENSDLVTGKVIAAIGGESSKGNMALIQCLSRLGGKKAFQSLKKLTNSNSQIISKEAFRTLAKWSSFSEVYELLGLVSRADDTTKILMVRGVASMIENSSASTTVKKKMLQKLLNLSPEAEKLKLLELIKKTK